MLCFTECFRFPVLNKYWHPFPIMNLFGCFVLLFGFSEFIHAMEFGSCSRDKRTYLVPINIHVDKKSNHEIANYVKWLLKAYDDQSGHNYTSDIELTKEFFIMIVKSINKILKPKRIELKAVFSPTLLNNDENLDKYCGNHRTITNITEQFLKDEEEKGNKGERHILIIGCNNIPNRVSDLEHIAYRENCGGAHGIDISAVRGIFGFDEKPDRKNYTRGELERRVFRGITSIFSNEYDWSTLRKNSLFLVEACNHIKECEKKKGGFAQLMESVPARRRHTKLKLRQKLSEKIESIEKKLKNEIISNLLSV